MAQQQPQDTTRAEAKFSAAACPKQCGGISRPACNQGWRKVLRGRICDAAAYPLRCPFRPRGFTLIEILLAIFILGLVMSTVYAAYSGNMKIVQEIEYENSIYNMARTTLDRLIRDLTSIAPLGGAFEMRADKEVLENQEFGSLFFWSAAHLAFNEDEIDGSGALIGYYVEEDAGGGSFSLRRSDLTSNKASKENTMQDGYVICRNIESLHFRFYDSKGREYDSWNSSSNIAEQKQKAPAAVQIELRLANIKNKEKPFKFMTKVFLPAQ